MMPSKAATQCRDEALAPSNPRPVRKPKPRLDRSAYVGRRAYHVTLTTTHRLPVFEDIEAGRRAEGTLKVGARQLGFELLAYCFMPDHLHVLLQGHRVDSDLLRFVQRFKQVTSFEFKRENEFVLWQQSFFDRVLRREDDPTALARYIFDNPAAAGLPADHAAFALRGGTYSDDAPKDGATTSSRHSSPGVEGDTND